MSKATKKPTTKPAAKKKGEKRLTLEDVLTPKAGAAPGGKDDACKDPKKEETCKNA